MERQNLIDQNTLLQEGVSCALSALYAIEAGDMFRNVPADAAAVAQHNHGCWLLGMLEEHLRSLQGRVDAFDDDAAQARAPTALGAGHEH